MKNSYTTYYSWLFCFIPFWSVVQIAKGQPVSSVWVPDAAKGMYRNPVIHADYSDPDVIRVGNRYYMTASSFNHVPGLPLLQSDNLVHWQLTGHALPRLVPENYYSTVRHGGGVWAPSIRYHNHEFYIFYPDPDFGIYVIRAKDFGGPWSRPKLVLAGKGLIDPCPLWDEDGRAYMVHAYAGSRAGVKSVLVVREMNAAADSVISNPVMVYDGHNDDPTIEGPKFYKRNGWYYLFAPAGGVSTGWQVVLRSRHVYGPYERRGVLHQGSTSINGPHQGAWVTTPEGENWFLHFQDKGFMGRVVHVQPMQWKDDWPVMGNVVSGDKVGEPVMEFRMPLTKQAHKVVTPPDSDEFDKPRLGYQWQWQANPGEAWAFPAADGHLYMFSVYQPDSVSNAWMLPNILAQKLPGDAFTATLKLQFRPQHFGEQFSFILLGKDYACISLKKERDSVGIYFTRCLQADRGNKPQELRLQHWPGEEAYLRISLQPNGNASFAYSTNGREFLSVPGGFTSKAGVWVGTKLGMFCTRSNLTNNSGYARLDWIRLEAKPEAKND